MYLKLHHAILLAPLLLAGCLETELTDPILEQRVFNVLGGLDVGEALTAEGPGALDVFLTGGQQGSTYLYVPFWATREEGTQTLNIEVSGTNLRSGPNRSESAFNPGALFPGAAERPREDRSFHNRLRMREQELNALIPGARAAYSERLRRGNVAVAVPQVGELLRINANANQGCVNPIFRTGRVAAVSNRAVILVDTANPANTITQAQYRSIAENFDNLIYRVTTRVYGEPADIDTNQRVIIFFTRAVNELTPPGSRGFVGGFFFSRDLFPRTATGRLPGCPASNVSEIFYLLAPDPQGVVNGNKFSERMVLQQAVSTTAHEFEHLINASRRLYVNNANSLEEPWLDEGLAHIAEELIFYEASGVQPRQNIGLDQIRASQRIIDAFLTYQLDNVERYFLFLENPSAESLMGVDTELETRGAIWSFLRYTADQRQLPESFFGQLLNARATGLQNLQEVLKADPVDLMQDWTVSVYADDFVPNLRDIYKQPSWNWRALLTPLNNNVFPLKVLNLSQNNQTTVELKGGGTAYITFSPEAATSANIRIRATTATSADSLRISVVRTR